MRVDIERCGLVFMTTMGCNASCGHCYFGSSPDKAKYRLSGKEMVKITRDARECGVYSITFSGGEPFMFPADLFMAISEASDCGMNIAVRTNGFWAVDDRITERVLAFLYSNGVESLGLSYDSFHSKFVNISCIKRIIRISEQLGLSVWLDWIGMETMQQVWDTLGEYMRVVRAVANPIKVGHASLFSECYYSQYPLESVEFEFCQSFICGKVEEFLFEIYPEGIVNLSGCCYANLRLYRQRQGGNGWIGKLVEQVENDPAVDFLSKYGVGGLIRKARKEMPDALLDSYTSDCEVCHSLLGKLFPIEEEIPYEIFSLNGYRANKKKLALMSQRLFHSVEEVSREYVADTKKGYILKPSLAMTRQCNVQ